MKVLNEYNENDYAKRIRAVEDCMRENLVSIDSPSLPVFVTINGKEFRSNSPSFPRMFEEDKLEIT
jgi:hypothetical protein